MIKHIVNDKTKRVLSFTIRNAIPDTEKWGDRI